MLKKQMEKLEFDALPDWFFEEQAQQILEQKYFGGGDDIQKC